MKTIAVILMLCVSVSAGAQITLHEPTPDITVTLPEEGSAVYVLECNKTHCSHIGPEIKALLERTRTLYEWEDEMEWCNMPLTTLGYRRCPESLKRDYKHKLYKDIEALIERMK